MTRNVGARRLAEHRAHLGLTLTALGDLWGFPAETLSRWEREERKPELAAAVKLKERSSGYVLPEHWMQTEEPEPEPGA